MKKLIRIRRNFLIIQINNAIDEIIYKSYIETGKELAIELKTKQNCDLVIALTHMRWHNDTILAEKVPEIDLFLGGHDHDYGMILI